MTTAAKIQGVWAREVLDCRGLPTIECTLWLDSGSIVATSVPTGTSIGKYEAHELRDGDGNRFLGKGVLKAVNIINTTIAPQMVGKDPTQQEELDQLLLSLDTTEMKENVGANTMLAVSQAVLKGGAISQNLPVYAYVQQKYQLTDELKIPAAIYTIVNGGEHGADNLDIQEFQLVSATHLDFSRSLSMAVAMSDSFERVLVSRNAIHSVGLGGGFTPNLYNNTDVFELMLETVKTLPFTLNQDFFLGIDAAASTFFSGGKYHLRERVDGFSSDQLLEYYKKLNDVYRVFLFEDPFAEDDESSWKKMVTQLGEGIRVLGDDLLVTNENKIDHAVDQKICNGMIIKPSQVGTITESINVVKKAKAANWQVVVSHRSGETNDDIIADLAVGVGANYTKFGPPNRGERIAKYNRLLMIDSELKQAEHDSLAEQLTSPT